MIVKQSESYQLPFCNIYIEIHNQGTTSHLNSVIVRAVENALLIDQTKELNALIQEMLKSQKNETHIIPQLLEVQNVDYSADTFEMMLRIVQHLACETNSNISDLDQNGEAAKLLIFNIYTFLHFITFNQIGDKMSCCFYQFI